MHQDGKFSFSLWWSRPSEVISSETWAPDESKHPQPWRQISLLFMWGVVEAHKNMLTRSKTGFSPQANVKSSITYDSVLIYDDVCIQAWLFPLSKPVAENRPQQTHENTKAQLVWGVNKTLSRTEWMRWSPEDGVETLWISLWSNWFRLFLRPFRHFPKVDSFTLIINHFADSFQ